MEETREKEHFLLVHGAGHGAWCWYKLVPLLRSAGHRVTALDMAASGIHPKQMEEIGSVHEYFQPLLDAIASLPPQEKVILVGNSLGGLGVSLAMEKFPTKISVAVFATAAMPGLGFPHSKIVREFYRSESNSLLDCKLVVNDDGTENPRRLIIFGHRFLASKLYNLCKPEDLILASMLLRPASLFEEDTNKDQMLTEDNHGSVKRVYILCKADELMNEDHQRWIVQNNPPSEVKEINGDHLVMLSKPEELCACLLEIAQTHCHRD
ncbi:methyl jasmonate esterase 1-like [Aristolochia californica]|uniref:methyl jasmonate esterase 1-like n=1 Tax=Aristolochia californica TaxID=171875 RepID=UPI0035D86F6B